MHARCVGALRSHACMRACVRAYVHACVRACVRAYGERPEGKDATRTRPYTRPRASTRALTCTCTRVNPFPRDNRAVYLRFLALAPFSSSSPSFLFPSLPLFFSFFSSSSSSSSSFLIFLQTLPSTVLLLYHDELCTRGYYSRVHIASSSGGRTNVRPGATPEAGA